MMKEAKSQGAEAKKRVNHFETHGLSATAEYAAWQGIKGRCLNPHGRDVEWYKGVKMHPAWVNDPVAFIEYMGPKPSPEHSIDRFPDRSGNYEPGNVRWANWHEQNCNKEVLHWVEFRGERMCIGDLAKRSGIPYFALYLRITKLGWDVERAASVPAKVHPKIEYLGKQYSQRALVREHGVVDFNTFRYRIKMGLPIEEALKQPALRKKRFK